MVAEEQVKTAAAKLKVEQSEHGLLNKKCCWLTKGLLIDFLELSDEAAVAVWSRKNRTLTTSGELFLSTETSPMVGASDQMLAAKGCPDPTLVSGKCFTFRELRNWKASGEQTHFLGRRRIKFGQCCSWIFHQPLCSVTELEDGRAIVVIFEDYDLENHVSKVRTNHFLRSCAGRQGEDPVVDVKQKLLSR